MLIYKTWRRNFSGADFDQLQKKQLSLDKKNSAKAVFCLLVHSYKTELVAGETMNLIIQAYSR